MTSIPSSRIGRRRASYSLSATSQKRTPPTSSRKPDGIAGHGDLLVVAGEGRRHRDVAELMAFATVESHRPLRRPAPDLRPHDARFRPAEDDVGLPRVVANGRRVEMVLVPVGGQEDVRREPLGIDDRRDRPCHAPDRLRVVGEVGIDHHGDALRRLEEVPTLAKPDTGGSVWRDGEGGDLRFRGLWCCRTVSLARLSWIERVYGGDCGRHLRVVAPRILGVPGQSGKPPPNLIRFWPTARPEAGGSRGMRIEGGRFLLPVDAGGARHRRRQPGSAAGPAASGTVRRVGRV